MHNTNKASVQSFFDAAAANDSETMLAIFHPNIRVIEAESLPYGGIMEGAANFQNFTKKVFTTWSNTRVTTEKLIAEDDYVVVLATMYGTSKASGTPFTMPIAEIWKFDNSGKAVEIKPFYFDTKKLTDLYQGSI
jgi:ketosteroid isomerase-like protein